MISRVFLATMIVLGGTSFALAGNATLKHSSGAKVKLTCKSSGCFEKYTDAEGNKGKKTRIGPGGRTNFLKHKAKWNSKGYS